MIDIDIKLFKGKNVKADPTDLVHECQNIDGFDTYKKPGALVKRSGYTDQAGVSLPSSYPSGWTIKNFFRFTVNKPSTQIITVVHAMVGGVNRIYVDYVYTGGAWVQGWVELTEMEEELTVDSSANTTTFVDSGLSSSVDDYYNGWYFFSWTAHAGALITDYVGSTKTVSLKSAVSSLAAASYSIYRFPMITQIEGPYTSDTGSSTTQVIDLEDFSSGHYELRQDFDDAYNGWTLENVTRLDTQSVTDYISDFPPNSRKLTHAAITAQTDGDSYYLYKKTRNLLVDDKIQFHQRPNTLIMATGNQSRHPKQYPMWYGFIRDTYFFGQSGNNIPDGLYLEPATLEAPADNTFVSGGVSIASPALDAGTYHFFMAYIYDGYQVGPITTGGHAETNKAIADGTQIITLNLTIGYSALPNMKSSRTLNKRVTGVIVFASDDFDINYGSGTLYNVGVLPIRQNYNLTSTSTKVITASLFNEVPPNAQAAITLLGRSTGNYSRVFNDSTWAGTDPYTRSFVLNGTVWNNKSHFYSLVAGGIGGSQPSYGVADVTKNHSVVGPMFTERAENSLLGFTPFKIDGTPSPDFFPTLNTLDMAHNSLFSITDIKIIRDFVFVIGSNKIIRMLMRSSNTPAFKIDTEVGYIGTDAQFGTLKMRGGVFVVCKSGCYFIDNVEHLASGQIEDITNYPIGATTMSEAYVGFNGETNEITIAFPTDTKLYTYNVITKDWGIHTVDDGIKALVTGSGGELYGAGDTKIYRLNNGTTQDGTGINPQWKSKVYSKPDKDLNVDKFEITYKSDTAIQFDVYIDRGSAHTWNTSGDNQLPASTTITTAQLNAPSGTRGKELELGITIPSSLRAANTYVHVDEIIIKINEEERT